MPTIDETVQAAAAAVTRSAPRRACAAGCIRTQTLSIPTPSRWQRLIGRLLTAEMWMQDKASSVLEWPVLAALILAVVVMVMPLPGQPAGPDFKATGTFAHEPIELSVETSRPKAAAGPLAAIGSRLADRWTILAAVGGFFSLIKLLTSVAKNESRYLTLDLAIDPLGPNSTNVIVTTIVENKLDDDKEIHNAFLLVGPASCTPEEILLALSIEHPALAERVRCGDNNDSWYMHYEKGDEGDLLSNSGKMWESDRDAEYDPIACLLVACPLDAGTIVAKCHGDDVAIIQSLNFYFDENDDIANERMTFPVALGASLFAPGRAYIARFYAMGTQAYPAEGMSSRCTAKAFVVPMSLAS